MMTNKSFEGGGFALDIGNTKTHGQVRGANHELVDDWTVPTRQHDSLAHVVDQGYQRALGVPGIDLKFAGLGFGGPVDPETGAAKLTLVSEFGDSVTAKDVQRMLGGLAVVLLNDVAASAHALSFQHFELDTTMLTKEPRFVPGPFVLVEIGTGVGVAAGLDDGTVLPSEAVRIHASNGQPYGLNLCGSKGFVAIANELHNSGLAIPQDLQDAMQTGDTLGPTITKRIADNDQTEFIQTFRNRYATYLGELLGTAQLAFLASRIFVGGSVGRAPLFLERLLETDEFWNAFSKVDALRGRDMPILRVNDTDASVKGAYAAAAKQYARTL